MHDPLLISVVVFGLLLAMMLLRVYVAVAISAVAIIGFLVFIGDASMAIYVAYKATDSFVLTAVPMFIFMGEVLVRCGAAEMLYRGASKALAWAPGGLLHANVGACAIFAAVSGSSPATAATIGTVSYPSLSARGYDTRVTLGSLAAGGTLGILIPPSISLIVYGLLAECSVGKLFAGGVVPGILLSGLFMAYIAFRAIRSPGLAPKEGAFSLRGLAWAFVDILPVAILMAFVLGAIFAGWATPTEAAALGTVLAFVIAGVLRKLNWSMFRASVMSALETTCMVLFIVVGASVLSSFLAVARVPLAFSEAILGSGMPGIVIIALIYLLYLFLGCFVDGLSMMVMTLPAILPVVVGLGYDVIWFGVVLTILIECGMLTPPMGINLFVIQGISKKDLKEVIAGSMPFFFIMLFAIVVYTAFPTIVTWLPTATLGN